MDEQKASVGGTVPSAVELVIDGDFDGTAAIRLLAREVRDLRERVARLEHEASGPRKARKGADPGPASGGTGAEG